MKVNTVCDIYLMILPKALFTKIVVMFRRDITHFPPITTVCEFSEQHFPTLHHMKGLNVRLKVHFLCREILSDNRILSQGIPAGHSRGRWIWTGQRFQVGRCRVCCVAQTVRVCQIIRAAIPVTMLMLTGSPWSTILSGAWLSSTPARLRFTETWSPQTVL